MERITQRNEQDNDYFFPYCFQEDTCMGNGYSHKCDDCELTDKICETLGQYEDLGLMPNQIKELGNLYTEKCGQIKEIVKRLEKESEDAKAHPEISEAYIRAIYIVKEIAEGYLEMTDDKLVDLALKKAEVKEGGQQNE